jgi:hypothetical protein
MVALSSLFIELSFSPASWLDYSTQTAFCREAVRFFFENFLSLWCEKKADEEYMDIVMIDR